MSLLNVTESITAGRLKENFCNETGFVLTLNDLCVSDDSLTIGDLLRQKIRAANKSAGQNKFNRVLFSHYRRSNFILKF